jgi:competence protein ComEA
MLIKKILAIAAMLATTASFAAVDVNKGTAAELDGLKGVGPAMSRRIVEAREQGVFKNWPDFMSRVKGVKEKKAAKLSTEGMTVNGQPFEGAAVVRADAKTGSTRTRSTPASSVTDAQPAKGK